MTLNHNILPAFKERRYIFIALFTILALFSGCSVKYSFSGASISAGVKTFSVQYFQNRAPLVQPGLSQYLTTQLIDKCKSQTSLKYITSVGDTSFEGEITEYYTRPTTVAADAQAAVNRFTITVRVKFTNVVDPDFSFDRPFSRYADYNSSLDLSAVEQDLSRKIVEELIEDIFNAAFVNW